MDLSQKVVLVTGGASGIGTSCVEEFLKNNVKGVVIADTGDGEVVAKRFNDTYGDGRVVFVKTNVTDEDSFDNAFKITLREYGNVDILLNCAGIIDEINWRKMYQVNVFGYVIGCQLAFDKYFPKHCSNSSTYVINIASLAGFIPSATLPNYTASKHAIIGLTRSYATNPTIAQQGTCVMALCPGVTDTPILGSLNPSKVKFIETSGDVIASFPLQKPEAVARSAVEIMRKAENGAIWIIDDGVLSKVDMPTYETYINCTKCG